FGPAQVLGDARSSHTGSTSTLTPSISTSIDECPIHVTRSPLSGAAPYTDTSVRNGPSCRRGNFSSLLLKNRGNTFNSVRNPPIVVGTGFRNFRPALLARRNIVIYGWYNRVATPHPTPQLRDVIKRVRQLHADLRPRLPIQIAPLIAHAHHHPIPRIHNLLPLPAFVLHRRHSLLRPFAKTQSLPPL